MSAILSIKGVSLQCTNLRWREGATSGVLRAASLPWAHAPGCECEVWETFTCDRCGRRFGYCLGANDDVPGACDFCWADIVVTLHVDRVTL